MSRYVRLSETLVVNPDQIAAVVVRDGSSGQHDPIVYGYGYAKHILIVPVMAASEQAWMLVETLQRRTIDTYTTPDVWDGKPIERTHYVREDDDSFAAWVQERVDEISTKLWPAASGWVNEEPAPKGEQIG